MFESSCAPVFFFFRFAMQHTKYATVAMMPTTTSNTAATITMLVVSKNRQEVDPNSNSVCRLHFKHRECAVASAYVPDGHSSQLDCPVAFENCPDGHDWQLDSEDARYSLLNFPIYITVSSCHDRDHNCRHEAHLFTSHAVHIVAACDAKKPGEHCPWHADAPRPLEYRPSLQAKQADAPFYKSRAF